MPDSQSRARAWRQGAHTAICDVLEPWTHGTVARATRFPSFWDYNLVRVDEDPAMSARELAAFADEALDGLEHRRLDVDVIEAAERLRGDFEAMGWRSDRLVWMRHEEAPPPGPSAAVEEVPYDAVRDLRVAWHQADFPGIDPSDYIDQSKEVQLSRGARILAVTDHGAPVAFAQLERIGDAAEISQVYVSPGHRGRGLGTALTRAAIEAAGDVDDLWIVADDEGRPKELYGRLGFRPVWWNMAFTRLP